MRTGLQLKSYSVPGIYGIFRVSTEDCYVGQSVNIRNRWHTHRQDFKANRHASKFMQRIFNKHGEQVFEFRVLEVCAIRDLTAREEHWMKRLRPKYNACPAAGSCIGFKHSEETREKLRRKMIGNKHAAGKSRSDEAKERQRQMMLGNKFAAGKSSRKGIRHTPESIALMSKNRSGIPSKFRGVPRSENVKRKMSETRRKTVLQNQPELGL